MNGSADALRIAFFGSSLLSTRWNGAATYYRGLVRALHGRGHHVTFFEPDALDRRRHRDLDPGVPWADVRVYAATKQGTRAALRSARAADVVVKASGVGVFDRMLEREVLDLAGPDRRVCYWDVDAPATLARVRLDPADPFRALVPEYDLILTYGGGARVRRAYRELGAADCAVVYNALDPSTHHPVPPDPAFDAALAFLGNRLPDREARVEEFFLAPARRRPDLRFLLGGSGWDPVGLPANVECLGHVPSRTHNAFNVTPLAVLNISRESMARIGYSPATRVFEAAGAGACMITDAWRGIETFLDPGREVLVARNGEEVAEILGTLSPEEARRIGDAARDRILAEHTYAHRALDVERRLQGLFGAAEDRPAAAAGTGPGGGRP